jgi:hypothetical protein
MRERGDLGIIILFLVIICFLGYCADSCGWNKGRRTTAEKQSQKPDTITRIIPHVLQLQPDQIIIRDTVPVLSVPVKIDTAAIIRNYLQTKIYRRQFLDSNFTADLVDTIKTGELFPGQLKLKITTFEIERTITQYKNPSGIFAGGFIGYNSFGLSASWIKNRNSLQLGTDLKNKSVFIGYQRKLSFED